LEGIIELGMALGVFRELEGALWGADGGSRVRWYTYQRSTIPERPQQELLCQELPGMGRVAVHQGKKQPLRYVPSSVRPKAVNMKKENKSKAVRTVVQGLRVV
jgi:hypothetical protein